MQKVTLVTAILVALLALWAAVLAADTSVKLADVGCLVGLATAEDSVSMRIVPKMRPTVLTNNVYVVPVHPWVLVCSDFAPAASSPSSIGIGAP